MKRIINYYKIFVWTIFIIGVLSLGIVISYFVWYAPYFSESLSNKPKDGVPAGEIVAGRVITQKLYLPKIRRGEKIYIKILFATYNRKNQGSIIVSLLQNTVKESIVLDTQNFKDNSYQMLSFIGNYTSGPAILEITGVNAVPGKAITAWLSSDAPFGGAIIDGKQLKKSLVFKIGTQQVKPIVYNIKGGRLLFWMFVLTYVLIIVAIAGYIVQKLNKISFDQVNEY